MTPRNYDDPFDAFDDIDAESAYPSWMEEDLHDYAEAAYNEMLMNGGDL
jgi:hypothetical protein